MEVLLCGEGPFEVFLKENADLKYVHKHKVEVESVENEKVVKIVSGSVHIQGTGLHFVLPGAVHFGFPFDKVVKILKFKKPIWQNRVSQ